MKILYNKRTNEYYLMTNNDNEFYTYNNNNDYIYMNSLKSLLEKIENINLENCKLCEDYIESDEIIIFETDSKEELLNLPNTHPELFI